MFLRKNTTNLVIGLLFIIIGLGLILDAYKVVDFLTLARMYWPILIVILAISRFISGDWKSGLFLGFLSFIFFGATMGFITVDLWAIFWPAMLVLAGVSILLKTFRSTPISDKTDGTSLIAIFGAAKRKMTSQSFRDASVTAMFGGFDLDLRNAKMSKDGAVVDMFVMFGGCVVRVPDNTEVRLETLSLFGGMADKTSVSGNPTGKVTIRGLVLFGGGGVTNKEDKDND